MKHYSAEPAKPILIIFARNPVPGQVKTRLIPRLGEAGACTLHLKLLDRTLGTACQCQDVVIELWTDSNAPSAELLKLVSDYSIPIKQQIEGNLGARMQHAISDALNRSDRVVLIGSDCPDWKADDLNQAFAQLNEKEVVITPALDGGYVLIGCRKNAVELFFDIPWGSDQVLAMTRARLESLGWTWSELPAHPDIDTETDLELVPELL